MIVESFNFDLGIKTYKKNRLIVDPLQLKNEILYNLEKTKKTVFNVRAFSYPDTDRRKVKSFSEVLLDLDVASIKNSFNFFIDFQGLLLTDVEMNDNTFFYPESGDEFEIVFCLQSSRYNKDNSSSVPSMYNYNQMKTLSKAFKTFDRSTFKTKFKELEVDNSFDRVSNLGFNITDFTSRIL